METLSSCNHWRSYFTDAHLLGQSLVTLGSLTVTNVTVGDRTQLWIVKVSNRNAVFMKLEMAWIVTASDFSPSLVLWLWTFWASDVKEGKELNPILTMKWLQRLCSVLVFSNKCCAYSSTHVFSEHQMVNTGDWLLHIYPRAHFASLSSSLPCS